MSISLCRRKDHRRCDWDCPAQSGERSPWVDRPAQPGETEM